MISNINTQPPKNVVLPNYIPQGCDLAFQLLSKELRKGADAKILVYYDPDIDGLMAGLLVETYLEQLGYKNKNYKYYLNRNRTHGFKLSDDALKTLKGYTIIAVDFSVEKEDFDRILKAGINLIVLDHHEIDISKYTKVRTDYVISRSQSQDTYGIILNNQYKYEPEEFRFLSGAGVVYYFLKYVEAQIHVPVFVDAPAMVGISLLSDIRAIESSEARSFLKYTFELNSEYMKYLQWVVSDELMSFQKFSPFGVPTMNRDFLDFTFAPKMNSLLRADKGEDALNLLRMDKATIERMRGSKEILGARDNQKKIIAEILREFKEQKDTPGAFSLDNDTLMVCCLTNDFKTSVPDCNITNYIGVACSQIKDDDKTGVILVIDKDTYKVIRGSVRGGKDGVDYLSIFQKNGVPSAGHHNAFGILECDVRNIDFQKIKADIEVQEAEFLKHSKNTRSVLEIGNLGFFGCNPIGRKICQYNELSRDNHRIYLKVLGDFEELEDNPRIKPQKVSDKYIRYNIDGVNVNCYDPSLDIRNSLIIVGFENSRYVKYTLRPGFKYDAEEDKKVISQKLNSLN